MADRRSVERQLATAQAELAAYQTRAGEKSGHKDPMFRHLDGRRRQAVNRMRAITVVEKRDAEVLERKAAASAEQ